MMKMIGIVIGYEQIIYIKLTAISSHILSSLEFWKVSISLDKRLCVVYSRDAERLLSAFDLASSRCSDVEALPEEYERINGGRRRARTQDMKFEGARAEKREQEKE